MSSLPTYPASAYTAGYGDRAKLFQSIAAIQSVFHNQLTCLHDTIAFDIDLNVPLNREQGQSFPLLNDVSLSSPANSHQQGGVRISYDPQTTGTTVDCAYWCAGVGFQYFPHPVIQTQTGYAIQAVNGAGQIDQPAFTNIGPGSFYRAAVARIGIDTVLAKQVFMEGWDLEMELGCKFKLFREALSTIGDYGCVENRGHGTPLADSEEDIRAMNDEYLARAAFNGAQPTYQFFPQNSVSVGGVLQPLGVATTPTALQGARIKGTHAGRMPIDALMLGPTLAFNLNLRPRPNCRAIQEYAAQLLSNTLTPTLVPSAIFTNNLTAFNITATAAAGSTIVINGVSNVVPAGGLVISAPFTIGGVPSPALVGVTQTQLGTQVVILLPFTLAGATFFPPSTYIGSPSSSIAIQVLTTSVGPGDHVVFKHGHAKARFLLLGCYVTNRCVTDWYKNWAPYAHIEYLVGQSSSLAMIGGMMNNSNAAPLINTMGLNSLRGVAGMPVGVRGIPEGMSDDDLRGRVQLSDLHELERVKKALYELGSTR
jgi:hypothetical protein